MGVANCKKLPRVLVSVDTCMPQQWYKTPSDVAFEIVNVNGKTHQGEQPKGKLNSPLDVLLYIAYSASA